MFIKFENLQFKIYNLKFSICNGDLICMDKWARLAREERNGFKIQKSSGYEL